MAVQLIANMAEDFDASKYKDVYQDKLKAIIKAKAKGKTIDTPETVERETTKIIDLVARLQESLAEETSRIISCSRDTRCASEATNKIGASRCCSMRYRKTTVT